MADLRLTVDSSGIDAIGGKISKLPKEVKLKVSTDAAKELNKTVVSAEKLKNVLSTTSKFDANGRMTAYTETLS